MTCDRVRVVIPPIVHVDLNMTAGPNTYVTVTTSTDPVFKVGDRFIALDEDDEPPIRLRAWVMQIQTPLHSDGQALTYSVIGERAKRISDVDQTSTFVMPGNWLWADIVPHWDRFEIV